MEDTKRCQTLPPELWHEVERIRAEFTVDSAKLKAIADQFLKELEEGLEKDGANIVGLSTWHDCYRVLRCV